MSGLLLVHRLQMKGWAEVPSLQLPHVNGLSALSLAHSAQTYSLYNNSSNVYKDKARRQNFAVIL